MLTHARPHIARWDEAGFSFTGTPGQTQVRAVAVIVGARAGVSTSSCVQAINHTAGSRQRMRAVMVLESGCERTRGRVSLGPHRKKTKQAKLKLEQGKERISPSVTRQVWPFPLNHLQQHRISNNWQGKENIIDVSEIFTYVLFLMTSMWCFFKSLKGHLKKWMHMNYAPKPHILRPTCPKKVITLHRRSKFILWLIRAKEHLAFIFKKCRIRCLNLRFIDYFFYYFSM